MQESRRERLAPSERLGVHLGTAVLAFFGLAMMAYGFIAPSAWTATAMAAAAAMVIAAATIQALVTVSLARLAVLHELPSALTALRDQVADLDAVRREHHRLKATLDGYEAALEARLQQAVGALDQTVGELRQVADADRQLVELRQAVADSRRQAVPWEQACIDHLKQLELGLSHDDLSPALRAVLERMTTDLAKRLSPLGLQVVRPELGEAFDDRVHRVIGTTTTEAVPNGCVTACHAWGFIGHDGSIRPAEVTLAEAPGDTPELVESVADRADGADPDQPEADAGATSAAPVATESGEPA